MNGAWEIGALIHSALLILMLPTALWLVNRLFLGLLDDRGMYQVPPFSWLPWLAGGILALAALDGLDITARLTPAGIWLEDHWSINLQELYELWLNPWDLSFAVVAAVVELRIEANLHGWRPWILMLTLLLAFLVAGLAWRGWGIWRGLFLFLWQTLVYMILLYCFVIGLAWVIHWLNFWLLPLIFMFLYLYDQDEVVQSRYPL